MKFMVLENVFSLFDAKLTDLDKYKYPEKILNDQLVHFELSLN